MVVQHRGGHTSFYNSKALEMADINKNTPNPSGGTFDRDTNGELNGRVTDRARNAFSRVGKRRTFSETERAQRDRDGVAHISKQFVRYGVTSVHHEGGNLEALQQVRARGELLHRVGYEANGRVLDSMIAAASRPDLATSGSASEPPPSTLSTVPSPSARWRSAFPTLGSPRPTRATSPNRRTS